MSPPPGARSRRLAALSLDDESNASNVVQRADKTVPLAIYGGSTSQGSTPLPPGARPSLASGNDGTTTAPLAAQSAPPAVSTPIPPSAQPVSAVPTPSGHGAAPGEVDKRDDEIEGPPMAKTPWVAIVVVAVVVIVGGVIAALVMAGGSGSKSQGAPAATTKSSSLSLAEASRVARRCSILFGCPAHRSVPSCSSACWA